MSLYYLDKMDVTKGPSVLPLVT